MHWELLQGYHARPLNTWFSGSFGPTHLLASCLALYVDPTESAQVSDLLPEAFFYVLCTDLMLLQNV